MQENGIYQRWYRFVNFIPKRIRIVVMTGIMSATILTSTFFTFGDWWYLILAVLVLTSYLTTYVAIFESIDECEWYMLFIMPIFFTLAAYLFYFLLPVRWLTRLPFVVLFALLYYAILLTENIFNIGVEKSLQLYRAAFSVNYLLHVLVMFLITQVIFSFRQHVLVNTLIILVVGFILAIQMYWTVNPESKFNRDLILYAGVTAILIAEMTAIISFVPFMTNVASLVMTVLYYSIGGILYHYFDGRLFKNIVREYLIVAVFVIGIAFLTLRW